MNEAGLVHFHDFGEIGSVGGVILGLTYQGHEFLDAVRDESRWEKTKKKAVETLGFLSLEGLKSAIGVLIKTSFY